jgi:uncharacterized SAM-binding protein YcdF (DUF218 family)
MGRIIRLLVQVAVSVLCFVLITAVWIIFDGLNDVGDSADVALVAFARSDDPQLEHVARLYKDGEFKAVIVTSANDSGAAGQEEMTRYLEGHGVPSSAIIEDSGAKDAGEMARDVAMLMRDHEMSSLMIVADYYRMTRFKLALLHSGVSNLAKSHVGSVRIADALPIGHEVLALYSYIGRTFLMPAAEKIKKEATTEADKAQEEAQKAKKSVDKDLDSLPGGK